MLSRRNRLDDPGGDNDRHALSLDSVISISSSHMKRKEMDYLQDTALVFEAAFQMIDDRGPSSFLLEHDGKIVLTDDEAWPSETIGSFSAIVVDVQSAMAEGEDLFHVFDSNSVAIGYFEDLYEPDDGEFKEKVARAASSREGFVWNPSLLILDRLIIDPVHRGHCVGLLALREIIQRLRIGIGLIAMKPFPLQFETRHRDDAEESARLGLNLFKITEARATTKLRQYYARLGFRQVPGSDYMVRSAEEPLPSAAALSSDFGV